MSRKVLSKDEFVRKVMADLPDAKKVKAAVANATNVMEYYVWSVWSHMNRRCTYGYQL